MKTIILFGIMFLLLFFNINDLLAVGGSTGANAHQPDSRFNVRNEHGSTHTRTVRPAKLKAQDQPLNIDQYMRLQLAKDAINTDDILIRFNSSATTRNDMNFDAPYFQGNGQVNLCSISSDNVDLAINTLPFPKKTVAVRLKIQVKADGDYALNMTQLVNIPQLFDVWLLDAYKKDSLDMRSNNTYKFDVVKSDTNTYGSGRFRLVIRQNPALAMHLLSFTATKSDSGTNIAWTTEHEQDYSKFVVEKSVDNGTTFKEIDSIHSSGLGTYHYLDKALQQPANQYRLLLQDLTGDSSYSYIVMPLNGVGGSLFTNSLMSVYPIPANNMLIITMNIPDHSNRVTNSDSPNALSIDEPATSFYTINIYTMSGTIVKTTTTTQQTSQTDVSDFIPGTYIIQVVNSKNNKVEGKGMFIKL